MKNLAVYRIRFDSNLKTLTSFFLRPYENNFFPGQDIEEILFGGDSSQKKKILHPARILNQAVISRLPAVHHPKFSKTQANYMFFECFLRDKSIGGIFRPAEWKTSRLEDNFHQKSRKIYFINFGKFWSKTSFYWSAAFLTTQNMIKFDI